MTSSTTSGAARQHARNKGLAWVSAITLGAGTASALGAVAIAMTLPGTANVLSANALASSDSTATVTTTTPTTTGDDDSSEQPQAATQQAAPLQAAPLQAAPLQAAAPPATTNNPPVATSAAS
ncbi:MAG: hypothetical protein ABIP19_14840 [Dermatophilaceae bacterium]